MGECGVRGGYAEIVNMDLDVMAMLQKSISAKLCPPILGQVMLYIIYLIKHDLHFYSFYPLTMRNIILIVCLLNFL